MLIPMPNARPDRAAAVGKMSRKESNLIIRDFEHLTIGFITRMINQGEGSIIVTGKAGSDHPLTVTLHSTTDDPDTPSQKVWTVTCAQCGTLGTWDNPMDALRTARQH